MVTIQEEQIRELMEKLGAEGIIVLAFDSVRYQAAYRGSTEANAGDMKDLIGYFEDKLDNRDVEVWESRVEAAEAAIDAETEAGKGG